MNKWVKRKWIRALRSGEYRQGQGWLVFPVGAGYAHCCLGVLACEMVPEYVRPNNRDIVPSVDGNTGTLPDDLAIHFGLDGHTQYLLSKMNDNGKDFIAIADWIDANL